MRAHALLSASGSHRWISCTPSAQLEAQFPDSTSAYAREGTLAHEICEIKLRGYIENIPKRTQTSSINKLKKMHPDAYQSEMLTHAEAYVDYIKTLELGMQQRPYFGIEKRVDFSKWVPEGFGTADCILIQGDTLYVIDFKYGKGVPVSAEKNSQMQLYALGAYVAYSTLYPINRVRMTIFQPRLSSISEWGCSIEDLLKFGEYVKERARIAMDGGGEYAPSPDACRFCRAAAVCKARAAYNVRLAFGDPAPIDKSADTLTNNEIGEYLKIGEDVARWLEDLKAHALSACLAGADIPGWKAVEGRGSRSWSDQEAAFSAIEAAGTPTEMLYIREPLSLSKIETLLGKKTFAAVAGSFVQKNPGKPALVQASDKRPAITNAVSAKEAFGDNVTDVTN